MDHQLTKTKTKTTNAFSKVVSFMNCDLVGKMQAFMSDSETESYGNKYMEAKLKLHFGNRIIITWLNGKANVVIFNSHADVVLHE